VARGCSETCNRNMLRALTIRNTILSLREEDTMIECARVVL
jgi:hypothetical protein